MLLCPPPYAAGQGTEGAPRPWGASLSTRAAKATPHALTLANREVLVKGNSVLLRLSASTDNLIKGKVEESHFALELKSAIFGQIREMDFPSFHVAEIPSM